MRGPSKGLMGVIIIVITIIIVVVVVMMHDDQPTRTIPPTDLLTIFTPSLASGESYGGVEECNDKMSAWKEA